MLTDPLPLPDGFEVGHWTDAEARTGCTVVIAPPGARGGVDVRGGGTGTREIESLSVLANAEGPDAVLLTGGSAFGLAAADGVSRWLEERGRGRPTPAGVVPLVPAAVVYDLVEGNSGARPGPEQGYAACEHAAGGVPERGALGAGAGAAVGKLRGREHATRGGVGYATSALAGGEVVAAVAVANAFGDVIGSDGELLGAPRGERGELVRTVELLAADARTAGATVAARRRQHDARMRVHRRLARQAQLRDPRADGKRRDRACGRPRVHTRGRRCRLLHRVGIRAAGRARCARVVAARRHRRARRST